MTSDAAATPQIAPRRRGAYDQQLHVLVDQETRAYVLGLAVEEAAVSGYQAPREGAEVRDLLDEAIEQRYRRDPVAYGRIVTAGQTELARRLAAKNG